MIIKGVVRSGRSLGRQLGFPTANIYIEPSTELANGVYRSSATICGRSYRAISNVGVKPTLGENHRAVETHVLDFEGDLYGQIIEVALLEKMRDEMRFESLVALQAQIELDIKKIKALK